MDEALGDKRPRQSRVKNKSSAPIQITAEQLLREAADRLDTGSISISGTRKKTFVDREDLGEYRQRMRRSFEDALRRNRTMLGTWIKYAAFEETQGDLARARSVYERALDVEPRNTGVWLKYAEMEMKHSHVNAARNVWDRATAILPRVDQFWYKYAYMEELLSRTEKAREVFERWMRWEPAEEAWFSFIKFEERYKQWERVRTVYERLVNVHSNVKTWLKYASFEESRGDYGRARAVYERADASLEDDQREPKVYIEFARFETRQKEYERARVIYKHALTLFSESPGLRNSYAQFERQHGDAETIEEVIIDKRRREYEGRIAESPSNYDNWFEYARLEEEYGDVDAIREVYERAIANIPPAEEKRLWRRYVYLWIYYAAFEELQAKDFERTEKIYQTILGLIPHRHFTFGKIWVGLAQFYIRRLNVAAARKLLGRALGTCPKAKLFREYIALEVSLREFERCRLLYQKWLEFSPASCAVWSAWAELESTLGDDQRARALFELAVEQEAIDMPELLWKAYIDFEYEEGQYDGVRELYERLLKRTEHIKVWVSYANFEASLSQDLTGDEEEIAEEGKTAHPMTRARAIMERAYQSLRLQGLSAERLLLLEAWRELELSHQGSPSDREFMARLLARFPQRVKKRRQLASSTPATAAEYEEYYDYVFPDDEETGAGKEGHLKLLQLARQWKTKALAKNSSNAELSEEPSTSISETQMSG